MYISANDLDFSDARFAVLAMEHRNWEGLESGTLRALSSSDFSTVWARVHARGTGATVADGAARQSVEVQGRPMAAVASYCFAPSSSTLLRKALGASPVAFLKKRVK